MSNYQICAKTVMDTSDPQITFDSNGYSNHYTNFISKTQPYWDYLRANPSLLADQVNAIKASNSSSEYNCILGLSGGLDSSYMLHKSVTEYNLRPLVFHVDAGWNSETAVHNINCMVDKLGLDLYTDVVNWQEVKAFQLSLFRSGVPHLDIPQDLAFISSLYRFASKHGIKYILNGGNISTESILMPLQILYWGTDKRHINDILSQFCDRKIKSFPRSNILYHKFYLPYVKRVKTVKLLNYLDFSKVSAIKELQDHYGWKPYSQKHFESRFTRFFEGYWLPTRFGYDMRRNQFSSLILSNQMSRSEALEKLESPPLSTESIRVEKLFVASKLGLSLDELDHFHSLPLKFYWDYKNSAKFFELGEKLLSLFARTQRGGAY